MLPGEPRTEGAREQDDPGRSGGSSRSDERTLTTAIRSSVRGKGLRPGHSASLELEPAALASAADDSDDTGFFFDVTTAGGGRRHGDGRLRA